MKERGTLATIPMEIGYLYTFNTVFYLKKTYQGLKVSILACKGNIGRLVENFEKIDEQQLSWTPC